MDSFLRKIHFRVSKVKIRIAEIERMVFAMDEMYFQSLLFWVRTYEIL